VTSARCHTSVKNLAFRNRTPLPPPPLPPSIHHRWIFKRTVSRDAHIAQEICMCSSSSSFFFISFFLFYFYFYLFARESGYRCSTALPTFSLRRVVERLYTRRMCIAMRVKLRSAGMQGSHLVSLKVGFTPRAEFYSLFYLYYFILLRGELKRAKVEVAFIIYRIEIITERIIKSTWLSRQTREHESVIKIFNHTHRCTRIDEISFTFRMIHSRDVRAEMVIFVLIKRDT